MLPSTSLDPELVKVLSSFVYIILSLTLPTFAGLLAVWLNAKIKQAKADLEAKQPDLARWLDWGAKIAVNAAEASGISNYALDKKAYAVQALESLLAAKGISVDLKALDAAIEKAWLEAYGQDKLVESQSPSKSK